MEPDDEGRFESEIPRDIVENKAEGEAFKEIEKAENDPVSEPLDVIMGIRRFDGFEREVGGKTPAHEVGYGSGEGVESVEDNNKEKTSQNGVHLGNLGALFEVVQDRVLCELEEMVRIWGTERDGNEYLFVKLVDVVACFVLGLNDERVLLKTLGGGHGEDEGAQDKMKVR